MRSYSFPTFIYVLCDPRDGRPRYVGKAENPRRRLADHLQEARSGRRGLKHDWMRDLIAANLKPAMLVVEETRDYLADAAERKWIGAFQLEYSDLLNLRGNYLRRRRR